MRHPSYLRPTQLRPTCFTLHHFLDELAFLVMAADSALLAVPFIEEPVDRRPARCTVGPIGLVAHLLEEVLPYALFHLSGACSLNCLHFFERLTEIRICFFL